MGKKSEGIWSNIERKDEVNTTSIWSPQRNCYCNNNTLQKHQSHGSLPQWWHQHLWHCYWSLTRRYISPKNVYNLLRLITMNINRSNKRIWFHIEKTRNRKYMTETMTDTDNTDDTPVQVECLLHSLKEAARGIGFYMNAKRLSSYVLNQKKSLI